MVHNLIVITFLWAATCFSLYLSTFMIKTVQGNIYVNNAVGTIAMSLGKVICYFLNQHITVKKSLITFFMLAFLGAIPIAFSETAGDSFNQFVVPICLFIFNIGNSGCFMNLYAGHLDHFPIVFAGTAMGICNIFARILTISAPMVAEIKQPLPEIILIFVNFLALIAACFIVKKSNRFY